MIVIPFRAEHLFIIDGQEHQADELKGVSFEYAKQLEALESYTAIHNGEVLACAGFFPFHDQRALCWTYLSKNAGKRFISLHKTVKRIVDSMKYNRLEMDVACDFEEGHRWAKLLGFELETPRMRAYFNDGTDAAKYVRIR